MPPPRPSIEHADIRRAYNAFKSGAGLRTDDVARLLACRGHMVSNNHLREFGRDSDRGVGITPRQLADLISAWADEVRPDRGPAS